MIPMPEEDETSKIHAPCPFCSGTYSVAGGAIRHSVPSCSKYDSEPPSQFLADARREEARTHAR